MGEQEATTQLAAILKSPLPLVGRRLVSALDNWREVGQVVALCKGLRRSPLIHSRFIACGGIRALVRAILSPASDFICPAALQPPQREQALDAAQAATVSLLVSLLQVPANREHVEHNRALATRLLSCSADEGLSLTSRLYALAAVAGITALEHDGMLELPPSDTGDAAAPGARELRDMQQERLAREFGDTKTWTQFVVDSGFIPQIVSTLLLCAKLTHGEAPPPAGKGSGLRLRFEGVDIEASLLKALFTMLNVHEAMAGGPAGRGSSSNHSSSSDLSNRGEGAGGSSHKSQAASKCAELRTRVAQLAGCGGMRALVLVLRKRYLLLASLQADIASFASEMDAHELFLFEVGSPPQLGRPPGAATRKLRRMERERAESACLLLRCLHVVACMLRADPCRLPGPEEAAELAAPELRDVLADMMLEEDARLARGARLLLAALGFPDGTTRTLAARARVRAQQRMVGSWVGDGMVEGVADSLGDRMGNSWR